MTSEPANTPQFLTAIASILQAIAWPIVTFILAFAFNKQIRDLLTVVVSKLSSATSIKAGGLEVLVAKAESEVTAVVEATGRAAERDSKDQQIPEDQKAAAAEVSEKLSEANIPEYRANRIALHKMLTLSIAYDRARTEMPTGKNRTVRMNEIAAQMRALSIACRPNLRSFMFSQSPGRRLAAICILQVVPEFGFFPWLIDRLMKEDQAFILYQASLAALEMIRTNQYVDRAKARASIQAALDHISGFKGGAPDPNTLMILREAISQLS